MDQAAWPALAAAARAAAARPAVPRLDLLRGAHLGFDPAQGRAVLADHASVVFLARLWDSARDDGEPVGPARVPDRIWRIVDADGDTADVNRRLLEATGLTWPVDAGQDLDFHLALWERESAWASRGAGPATAERSATCDGPVWVEARQGPDGLEVELRSHFPGRQSVELHWPDGSWAAYDTPDLRAGQLHRFAAGAGPLPTSIRVTRRRGAGGPQPGGGRLSGKDQP
jgi:hypothetical protein